MIAMQFCYMLHARHMVSHKSRFTYMLHPRALELSVSILHIWR
jgi:hypothetical protein